MSSSVRTVGEVLSAAASHLEPRGVDASRIAVELLASRLLACPRLELSLHYDRELSASHLEAMRRGTRRLASGEPVQYILGETEFRGHPIRVDSRCLIPRPETELLVQAVLDCAPLWEHERPGIVDIGTGSGCIVISLALERPAGAYAGLDISADALALAKLNAEMNGLGEELSFLGQDPSEVFEPESVHAIVTNPPYIRSADCDALPPHIRDHEPRMALDGGPDGFSVIDMILGDAPILLKSDGWLFMEIAADQGPGARERMQAAGFDDVTVSPDLAGLDRIVTGRLAV